jgi:large subunit ribosomal protein L25
MSDSLEVASRSATGTRACRKLRQEGKIPAVLYGHGESCVDLTVTREAVEAMVRHGSRTVELRGAVSTPALVRELQWNTYGTEPLHVDFLRIDLAEKILVTVPVELRGECPGVKAGGVFKHVLHQLEVECTAQTIPETAVAHIAHLEAGGVVKVKDLELPAGTRATVAGDEVIASCLLPGQKVDEATEMGEATAEPAAAAGEQA